MEKDFFDAVNITFDLDTQKPGELSPLILAYIGDAVYEVVVRQIELSKGNRPIVKLHRASIKRVNAGTQAELIELIEPELSEEELSIYKRGRNAKAATSAKNASIGDYRKATGFEALMGYLYISNRSDRMLELINSGFTKMESKNG